MQLRNSFVNLVLLLIYHVTTVKGRIENLTVTEGGLCPSDLYYSVDKCMPRGEIHNWVCRYNGRWARRKWKDKKCSGKQSKCQCERILYDDYDNYKCKCVDATKHPDFPVIGVLKWTEKVDFELNEDHSWVKVKTQHEIHRNGNGFHLRKYAHYNWENAALPYEYKFVILVPIEGKFKQISGKLEDKICQVKIVKNRGKTFDSMWSAKELHTLTKNVQKSKTISTQVWERGYRGENVLKSIWEMEYDSKRDVATPVRQHYSYSDYYVEKHKVINRDFMFTQLQQDDVSFYVKDYCKNDV